MPSNTLLKRYPKLFSGPKTTINVPLGWDMLVEDLVKTISIYSKEEKYDHFRFLSIDTKFGALMIFKTGEDAFINKVINFAEVLSNRTCQDCGDYAVMQSSRGGFGFQKFAVLCEPHSLKRFYKKV